MSKYFKLFWIGVALSLIITVVSNLFVTKDTAIYLKSSYHLIVLTSLILRVLWVTNLWRSRNTTSKIILMWLSFVFVLIDQSKPILYSFLIVVGKMTPVTLLVLVGYFCFKAIIRAIRARKPLSPVP